MAPQACFFFLLVLYLFNLASTGVSQRDAEVDGDLKGGSNYAACFHTNIVGSEKWLHKACKSVSLATFEKSAGMEGVPIKQHCQGM